MRENESSSNSFINHRGSGFDNLSPETLEGVILCFGL